MIEGIDVDGGWRKILPELHCSDHGPPLHSMAFHDPRTPPFPSFPLHFSISFHLTLHSLCIFHLASLEHIFRAHLLSTSLEHISILSIHFHLHSSSCTLTISPPRRSCGGTQHPMRRSIAARSCRPRATGAPTSSSRAAS